jgi:hypothetical protein
MSKELFAYRHNSDSTVDAICLTCFMTVATGQSKAEVRRLASSGHPCCAPQPHLAHFELLAPVDPDNLP